MVEPGRPYFITSQISPFALTLSGEDNVLGYELGEEDNQKVRSLVTPQSRLPPSDPPPQWIAWRVVGDLWTFKNVANGKFLSIADEPESGVPLIGADYPTLWRISPGPQGPDFFRYR